MLQVTVAWITVDIMHLYTLTLKVLLLQKTCITCTLMILQGTTKKECLNKHCDYSYGTVKTAHLAIFKASGI